MVAGYEGQHIFMVPKIIFLARHFPSLPVILFAVSGTILSSFIQNGGSGLSCGGLPPAGPNKPTDNIDHGSDGAEEQKQPKHGDQEKRLMQNALGIDFLTNDVKGPDTGNRKNEENQNQPG